MGMAYLSLVLVDQWFKTDYRFWVMGLKPLDAARSMQLPGYLMLWSVFFLIAIRSFCARIFWVKPWGRYF